MTEDLAVESTTQTAGAQLAQGRKERNMSVADAAAKLRIAPRQIEALEADDYERLPGHTIARGFVRNYARLLQLNPETILGAFEKHVPKVADARISLPDQKVQFSEGGNGHHNRMVLWLTLGLLLLTALGYVFWRWEAKAVPAVKPVVVAPVPLVVMPLPAESVVAMPSSIATAATSSPSVEPSLAPATNQTQASGTPQPGSPQEMPLPPNLDHVIHFAFTGSAKVEIHDQAGKIVWQKNNASGTEQDVPVSLPVSVIVGNSKNVKMTYNGDAFELAPHAKGNVARFKLE